MPVSDYQRAIVRTVPRSYAPAYASKGIRIDASLADAQHGAYVAALERAGIAVKVIAADEAFYDCVFVEDTAVVWRDRALVTRMAEHRQGEQSAVVAAIGTSHALQTLAAGSRLEGGDVLHTDETTYVGLTGRTNERGAAELTEFLGAFRRRVVPVPVSGSLHLKSVATFLGDGTLLVEPGHLDAGVFDVEDVISTSWGEGPAANCVRARDTLIVRGEYPATLEKMQRFAAKHAVVVIAVNLSEFEKGDGSATCLSLLWRD